MSDLHSRFVYHPPTPEKTALHDIVRSDALEMCEWYEENLPASREKSLALTKLEEAMFWANAAIARHAE